MFYKPQMDKYKNNLYKIVKNNKVKSESEVTCGQVWWPVRNLCSAFNPSKCTHTQQWTHTHTHTHTVNTHPEQWAANAVAPGNLRLEPATFGLQVWLSIH